MMKTVLIIGAGSAGKATIKTCLEQQDVFSDIHVASRSLDKLEQFRQECQNRFHVHACDADDTEDIIRVIQKVNPFCVINMALPYHDLPIMEACLKTETHYLDTANYEPKDEAKFCYKWQWDYHERFKEKGLMALLGCGFDPGVTNVFCAYAQKKLFDSIETIDIIDCNDGDHGHPFATNFNPEINIREVTQRGKYWEKGRWIETDPLSVNQSIYFPEIGNRQAYLMYHEELESLVLNINGLQKIRFWMTFSESYLTHLKVLENVGLTRIDPISYKGQEIVPLQFLKELLPDPSTLGENYEGKTCIACVITGIKDGKKQRKVIYNVCSHQDAYKRTGSQAVGFTTGVPAAVAARMLCTGTWFQPGVINIEQCDPEPFLEKLTDYGLPWTVLDYEPEI